MKPEFLPNDLHNYYSYVVLYVDKLLFFFSYKEIEYFFNINTGYIGDHIFIYVPNYIQ